MKWDQAGQVWHGISTPHKLYNILFCIIERTSLLNYGDNGLSKMFLIFVSCFLGQLSLAIVVIEDGRHVLSVVADCRIVPFPEKVQEGFVGCLSGIKLNVYCLSMITTTRKKRNSRNKYISILHLSCRTSDLQFCTHTANTCTGPLKAYAIKNNVTCSSNSSQSTHPVG